MKIEKFVAGLLVLLSIILFFITANLIYQDWLELQKMRKDLLDYVEESGKRYEQRN